MLKEYSDRFYIRILSLSAVAMTLGMQWGAGKLALSISAVCPCVMSGSLIIQFTPHSYEKTHSPLAIAIAVMMLMLSAEVVSLLAMNSNVAFMAVLSSFLIVPIIIRRTISRYREKYVNFESNILWTSAEDFSRMTVCLVYVMLYMIMAFLDQLPLPVVADWVATVGGALFYGFLYYKSRTGKTLIMSSAMEDKLISTSATISKFMSYGSPEEKARMEQVFQKIETVMEKDKPFLKPDFTLDDLAYAALANRSYVSRAIHDNAEVHYCRYINKYRIKEALRIIEEDPEIKVVELSVRCGFNSPVTFNTAFKDEMKMTPGKYAMEVKLRQLLSTRQERRP